MHDNRKAPRTLPSSLPGHAVGITSRSADTGRGLESDEAGIGRCSGNATLWEEMD